MSQFIDLLFENYHQKPSKVLRALWDHALAGFDEEAVKAAVVKCITERQFMPNIAQFKELVAAPKVDKDKIKLAVSRFLLYVQEFSYTHNMRIGDDSFILQAMINLRGVIKPAQLRNDQTGEYFRFCERSLIAEYIRISGQAGAANLDFSRTIEINSAIGSDSIVMVFIHEDRTPVVSLKSRPKAAEQGEFLNAATLRKIADKSGWGSKVSAILENKHKEKQPKEESTSYRMDGNESLPNGMMSLKDLASRILPQEGL